MSARNEERRARVRPTTARNERVSHFGRLATKVGAAVASLVTLGTVGGAAELVIAGLVAFVVLVVAAMLLLR
ncbi:hypothetical protein ACIBSW_22250 [Actinoplanes sp. NPDC049668]|uniref:hypothetical protein n=1 Tax=unclassified Actinoplanes TaxID=2626549 RepID=UPI0033AF0DF6